MEFGTDEHRRHQQGLAPCRSPYVGQARTSHSAWGRVKRWSGDNPRLSRLVWIVLGLAILALVIWAIYPKPAVNNRFNQGAQPVGVATAANAPIRVTLNALGTVTPLATATVRPQVGGLLTKLYFTEGQMVKAGDLLAQIDPRPYQAALDQAKGQLARDQANLANAKVDLARYQALAAQNAISGQQVATQAALVRSDAGVVESDQANVETAAINLGYTRIVSPVEGRAGLHQMDVGNIVQAGQTTGVVVVTELSPMSVLFTVPEDNISQIMGRVSGGAVLEVDAWDRSQTTQARQRQARHRGQCGRSHHRHGQAARHVRQYRQQAVPQPVRQYPASGGYACRTRPWCRWRRSSGAPPAPSSSSSVPTRPSASAASSWASRTATRSPSCKA